MRRCAPVARNTDERPERPTRVLVVDDERTIPFMLARALGGDYAIEHVSDPAVIAALPDSPTPDQHDVIVLDVGLAELSGLDVLAALRAAGCLHTHEVERATIETNGQITVVLRNRDSWRGMPPSASGAPSERGDDVT